MAPVGDDPDHLAINHPGLFGADGYRQWTSLRCVPWDETALATWFGEVQFISLRPWIGKYGGSWYRWVLGHLNQS
jgi:hypothetical protein